MAIDFYQIDNLDVWTYLCPLCRKRGEVTGDDINYAKNGTGELELACGHAVSTTQKAKLPK